MAGFKAERRSIRQSANALERDRMSDFRFAGSQLDAIYGALAKTRRKVGKRITSQNARILDRMAGIVARQRQGSRRVTGAQAESVSRYGGAIAGAVGEQFKPATTMARTGKADALAGQAVGLKEAKTDQTILGIAEAGAAEARAGADYALAQALAERTNQDVTLIAQQKHDLAMAKIQQRFQLAAMEKQADLDYANWKKQQEFLQGGAAGVLGQQASTTGETLAALMPEVRAALADSPEASVQDILGQLDTTALSQEEQLYLAKLIQNVKTRGLFGEGAGTGSYDAGIDAIVDAMVALNPELAKKDKLMKALKAAIEAQLRATYNRISAAHAREALEADAEAPATPSVGQGGGASLASIYGVTPASSGTLYGQ